MYLKFGRGGFPPPFIATMVVEEEGGVKGCEGSCEKLLCWPFLVSRQMVNIGTFQITGPGFGRTLVLAGTHTYVASAFSVREQRKH